MAEVVHGNGFLERGGGWVVAQSVLMTTVILLAVVFHGDWTRTWLMVLGGGLFVLGGVFGIAGVAVLGRNRTPFPKPRAHSDFVQHGIYARVRHPLYSSVMLASPGWALIWQSWPALVVALALIPFFVAKTRREEHWLRVRFPDYVDYEKRVPPFLPRIWSRPPTRI